MRVRQAVQDQEGHVQAKSELDDYFEQSHVFRELMGLDCQEGCQYCELRSCYFQGSDDDRLFIVRAGPGTEWDWQDAMGFGTH